MEARGVVLDTMVWAHAVNRDSPYFGEARRLVLENESRLVLLPNIAMELYSVLTGDYGVPPHRAEAVLLGLLERYPVVPITRVECVEAVRIAAVHGISVFDALIVAAAVVNRLVLITFDKKLERVYKKLCEPKSGAGYS